MLGAIVLATTPNEFDTETDETAEADTKDESAKNVDLDTLTTKCSPSSKMTANTLQTPVLQTLSETLNTFKPHHIAARRRFSSLQRAAVTSLLPSVTTAAYFAGLLLLITTYLYLLPTTRLVFTFASVFTTDIDEYGPLRYDNTYRDSLLRAVEQHRYDISRNCASLILYNLLAANYRLLLPPPDRVAEVYGFLGAEFCRAVASGLPILRYLADIVMPYSWALPLVAALTLQAHNLVLRYFPQYRPTVKIDLCASSCELKLKGLLQRFDWEVAQASTQSELFLLHCKLNFEVLYALATEGRVLHNARVADLLKQLSTLDDTICRTVNWARAAEPFNKITADLAEGLGCLHYELHTVCPEIEGLYATVALIILVLCQVLFVVFHTTRNSRQSGPTPKVILTHSRMKTRKTTSNELKPLSAQSRGKYYRNQSSQLIARETSLPLKAGLRFPQRSFSTSRICFNEKNAINMLCPTCYQLTLTTLQMQKTPQDLPCHPTQPITCETSLSLKASSSRAFSTSRSCRNQINVDRMKTLIPTTCKLLTPAANTESHKPNINFARVHSIASRCSRFYTRICNATTHTIRFLRSLPPVSIITPANVEEPLVEVVKATSN